MSADYDIDSIKDLDGISHIQLRPSMYTDISPEIGCHHIAQEVLDNSGDEAIGGFCNKIIVEVESENIISVTDNGRGIPVKANKDGISGVELVLTKDKAGGKFDHDAYKVSGGLHGVGITVTNALSSWLEATVKRDGGEWFIRLEKGRTTEQIRKVADCGPRTHGTQIRFSPNPEYYERPKFRTQQLRQQSMDKAILIPGLEVVFKAPDQDDEIFCFSNGLSEFMASQMESSPMFEFSGQMGKMEKVHWFFAAFSDPVGVYSKSYVNAVPTPRGGTHIKGFENGILKAVREYVDMRPELKKGLGKKTKIAASDVMGNSQLGLSIYIQDVKFEGQTKQKLNSGEATKFVGGIIHDSASLWLNRDVETSDVWVKMIIDRASARTAVENGKTKKVDRKTFTGRTPLPGKLQDCRNSGIDGTEIFIVEGDSAGGSAKQACDRDTQAVIPIKGKILNCEGIEDDDAISSQAVADLLIALGSGAGEHCNPETRRYGQIIILTDADIDGSHIQTLLATFFYRQTYPLIEAGCVYIAVPPLYGATIGKDKHYAQDDDELDGLRALAKAENKKFEYMRYKGLGEMNPDELAETCMDRESRVLIQVKPQNPLRMDSLMTKLMGDEPAQRRKLLMGEEVEDAEFVGQPENDPCDITQEVDDVDLFRRQESESGTGLPFETVFRDLYKSYGLQVVGGRAIPDVRDGMKPVHRRILYAMERLGLKATTKTKKSARVVGDVIGKYHPHGDSSVYSAMVRMAQPWAMRYMYVDGQGNFGSIDGDSAAAMRYTEARLTPIAEAMLGHDLKDGITPYQPNYDDQDKEPMILPSPFPSVLMNGTTGNPGVGFKSEIPPHNLTQLLGASIALAEKREKTGEAQSSRDFSTVRKHITAPDFPGGGILTSTEEELDKMYASGRGKMLLRAKWEVEHLEKGQWQIIVTEIPYGVEKSPLLINMGERISDPGMKEDRRLAMLDDLRDESEGMNIRIILYPKTKSMDPEHIMAHLFAKTDLQVTIEYATYALEKWVDAPNGDRYRLPELFSLDQMIRSFLNNREIIVTTRSKVRLAEAEKRIHVLEGLIKAYPNMRKLVIDLYDAKDKKGMLLDKYGFTEIQADAILSLRLSQLGKLDEMKLQSEHDNLIAEVVELKKTIEDHTHRWQKIKGELKDALEKFGDDRRTIIDPDAPKARVLSKEQLIAREPVTAVLSKSGWLKGMRGSSVDVSNVKFREGDKVACSASGYTTNRLVFIGRTGKAFNMLAADLPGGRGAGEPISKNFIFTVAETPNQMVMIKPEAEYLVVTTLGHAFRAKGDGMLTANKKGKAFINFPAGSKLLCIKEIEKDHNACAFITEDGALGIVDKEEFPILGKGKGVAAVTIKKGSKGLRDAAPVNTNDLVRVGTTKRSTELDPDDVRDVFTIARGRAAKRLPMACVNGILV